MILQTVVIGLLYVSILAGQLVRIPISSTAGSAVALADLMVGLIILTWAVGKIWLAIKNQSWRILPWSQWLLTDKVMLLFQSLLVLTFAFSFWQFPVAELKIGATYLVRLLAYSSLYWVVRSWKIDLTFLQRAYRWLIWTGVIIAITGIVQLVIFPDFAFLVGLGWDPHIGRLTSTFLDPNYVGIFLGVALAMASAQLAFGERKYWPIYTVICLLLFVTLYFAYSRSAWVSTALAVAFVGHRHNWKTAILILLLFVGVLFLPGRFSNRFSDAVTQTKITTTNGVSLDSGDDTSRQRILSWQKGWAVVKSAPVFGVGYNNYGIASVREGVRREKDLTGHSGQGSDSSLLNTWATTGIFGLAALLVLLWAIIRPALRLKRSELLGDKLLYFGFAAAFIGILIDSFLINSLYYSPLLIIWVVFAGLFSRRPA